MKSKTKKTILSEWFSGFQVGLLYDGSPQYQENDARALSVLADKNAKAQRPLEWAYWRGYYQARFNKGVLGKLKEVR